MTINQEFKQLGLLLGSSMLWKDDTNTPQQITNLIKWTLNLHDVPIGNGTVSPRLGVSAPGFAHIYYTLLQEKKPTIDQTQKEDERIILDAFPNLKTPSSASYNCFQGFKDPKDPVGDLHKFHKYTQDQVNGKGAAGRHDWTMKSRSYIWLDSYDAQWWVPAIMSTFTDYLKVIKNEPQAWSDVASWCEWLECSVFAPFNIHNLPALTGSGFGDQDKQQSETLRQQLLEKYDAAKRSGSQKADSHYYLTWNLFAFDNWSDGWSDNWFYRTMFSLWTAWPYSTAWAPPKPRNCFETSYSLDESASLLVPLLEPLCQYFLLIRDAHGLKLSKLPVEEANNPLTFYPPVFYFADQGPDHRPHKASEYVENEGIHQLIKNCIGYDDPHADKLSWSALEGSIVAVRGEVMKPNSYKACYLLLPTATRLNNDKEIGSDLDYIVDLLTFLEYAIILDAAEIVKKVQDILDKKGVDIETLTIVDTKIQELVHLVSRLPSEVLQRDTNEFMQLQILFGRVQDAVERMKGDTAEIVEWYDTLISRSNEYLRKEMIIASVSNLPRLAASLEDAYPYHRLQNLMKYVPRHAERLVNISKRVSSLIELLSTANSYHARKRLNRQERQIQVLAAIIAVAALLAALPQFFSGITVQSILQVFGNPTWTWYQLHTGIIGFIVLCLALVSLLIWFFIKILHRTTIRSGSKEERNFQKNMRKYEGWAEDATNKGKKEPIEKWAKELDNIDKEAIKTLQELWPCLGSSSQVSSRNGQQTPEDIIAEVRKLRRQINVFVIRPDKIPLPRTLCILRYKSLQFLPDPTISDNEFLDDLEYVGFKPNQVKILQDWLFGNKNIEWIKKSSVEDVAKALEKAHVKANPTQSDVNNWHDKLSEFLVVTP